MDIEKKTLIFMNETDLKPTGGPVGYLYNVKSVIEKNNIKNIVFLKKSDNIKLPVISYIKSNIPVKLKEFILNFKLIQSVVMQKKAKKKDFSEFDIVHFHSTYTMFLNRESIRDFEGKVLLTSHSPKPYHLEIIDDKLSNMERRLYKRWLKKMKVIDQFSFERADYIIFPCEEAEEPYLNNWDEYIKIRNNKNTKLMYVPTGSLKSQSKLSRYEVLNKYSIPQDSFIICYVGRHNETKGYNSLRNIGQQILDKYENVYFLIAGKEEPIKGLDHERWIEVGWTNDPHSIINSSNLFILPNKETYFDLILLEVLSLGKLVLASNTGGNKYFKKFKENGIYYYDSTDQAIKQIDKIIEKSFEKREEEGKRNLTIYEQNFTMEKFIERYSKTLRQINEEIFSYEKKTPDSE